MSNAKDYRAQLLEAAAALSAVEAKQTPEAVLQEIVIRDLGLPEGTVLSDEQWSLVLNASAPQSAIGTLPANPAGHLDGLELPKASL